MPMLTGIWENFTDSEGMKTPKIDCLLKFQDKEVYISAWIPGLSTLTIPGSVPP